VEWEIVALKVLDYARHKSNASVHAILKEFNSSSNVVHQLVQHYTFSVCVCVRVRLCTTNHFFAWFGYDTVILISSCTFTCCCLKLMPWKYADKLLGLFRAE